MPNRYLAIFAVLKQSCANLATRLYKYSCLTKG